MKTFFGGGQTALINALCRSTIKSSYCFSWRLRHSAFVLARVSIRFCAADAETLKYVCGEFERIGNIRVFVVLGNHDYGLKYEFPSNVHLFKNYIEKISVENVDVYGVIFDEEHCARCIIEGFTADDTENINILVVHCDVQSTSLYNPVKDEDIKYSKMALRFFKKSFPKNKTFFSVTPNKDVNEKNITIHYHYHHNLH